MKIIPQIAQRMVEKVFEKLRENGLGNIGKTIQELQPVVSETVLEIVKVCTAEMDNALVGGAKSLRRQDGISVKERHVPRTILTKLGEFTYERTYFQVRDGKPVYLLDQVIGIERYERLSKELVAQILQASAVKSYQHAVDITEQKISRQTVHNRLLAMKEVAAEVKRVDETPETLELFADEDHAHLRPKGSAMVPLVTITEGIDTSDPKRHKTIHPFHVAAYGPHLSAINENVLAIMTERYDLDKVRQINIHADGGNWIQGLQKLLPRSRLVMDGYHLEKHLRSFLRQEGATPYASVIRKAMQKENGFSSLKEYCHSIYEKQTTEAGKQHVLDFENYCAAHWHEIVLRMNHELCGSCTEPMVSHVLSDRLSRNPFAWSKDGLSKMTMLVVYRKNDRQLTADDIRVRVKKQEDDSFREDGYAKYIEYATKQSDDFLNTKHDWSLFDKACLPFGKVDGAFLVRKSFGALKPLASLIS